MDLYPTKHAGKTFITSSPHCFTSSMKADRMGIVPKNEAAIQMEAGCHWETDTTENSHES